MEENIPWQMKNQEAFRRWVASKEQPAKPKIDEARVDEWLARLDKEGK